jgi:uncharacterized protein (UPF0335 family)
MAKRVKKESEPEDTGNGVAAFRGNGFDPAIANSFIERCERLYSGIDTLKGEFMQQCKTVHDDVKEVLKEAKNAGIPKKAMKSVLKQRKLERDIEDIRTDLEGDDQDSFDQLVVALGKFAETDLGAAAASRAAA